MQSSEAVQALNKLEQRLLALSKKIDETNMIIFLDNTTFFVDPEEDNKEKAERKKILTVDLKDLQAHIVVSKSTVQSGKIRENASLIKGVMDIVCNRFDKIQAEYDSLQKLMHAQ